jgi:hypothetical protein
VNIADLYSEHGVEFRRPGEHHHAHGDWVQADCPYCSPNWQHFRLENLKYGTQTRNNRDKIRHGTITRGVQVNTAKLTPAKVRCIRRRRAEGWTLQRLASKYGVSVNAIHLIAVRKNWNWV